MNKLETRKDLEELAASMIRPLIRYLTPGKSRLILGNTGAFYDEGIAGMEGFSRVMWALVPMLAGKCPSAEEFWPLWKEGILHGTDPDDPEYWGDIGDFDQRMVEMAVMGMGLCLIKERMWDELTLAEQDRLFTWLDQINHWEMPLNNWLFFRVLVNTGFRNVGRPFNEDRLRSDLDILESHYEKNGWYHDKATQRDYYTMWAFHYYGLVYAKVMKDMDPERSARFMERARLIAPRFACWFDAEGMGLPYGRSLTYRFAQSSFFSALALSGADASPLTLGQVKGLLLRNLRVWMKKPVFDRDHVLTIGYGYPNMLMTEGYNAPGSPYWCMKVFATLALPEDDPFWQAEEETYLPPERFLDAQARLLITRDRENRTVLAYTAGNHAYEHMHEDEKYEKFVYSTRFAFSVVKEAGTLKKGAYDSMLVFKGDRGLWHGRSGCDEYELTENEVRFTWRPMDGVKVHSRVIPVGNWHIRVHDIDSERNLEAAEGAFSVEKDWPGTRMADRIPAKTEQTETMAQASAQSGTSAIWAIKGWEKGEVISPEPNTNLMWPRTLLPMLMTHVKKGHTRLICAVYAYAGDKPVYGIQDEVIQIAEGL